MRNTRYCPKCLYCLARQDFDDARVYFCKNCCESFDYHKTLTKEEKINKKFVNSGREEKCTK